MMKAERAKRTGFALALTLGLLGTVSTAFPHGSGMISGALKPEQKEMVHAHFCGEAQGNQPARHIFEGYETNSTMLLTQR